MNPDLLAYAQSLGLYLDPLPKPEHERRKPGPAKGTAMRGRPRNKCPHTEPRRVRPDGRTYCRPCESARSRSYYHRDKPGARYYREKTP